MDGGLSRRDLLKAGGAAGLGAVLAGRSAFGAAGRDNRPNILWVVSEDTSPLLGCYGDGFANTPNLDRLASEGVLYENAFANAPVCAPARCTIITGMYASSLGTLHMRSRHPTPDSVRFFPQLLRAAGYYCANNAKEDYNARKPHGTWDESSRKAHYRNRAPGQPFFSVFNYGASHESCIFGDPGNLTHDPGEVSLPPYHPDLPEVRHDWAEYYDAIQRMDDQIGRRLEELEESGLAENTIVFYYGDHGGVLARSKRYLFDSGTRVPMIVRFPEKWRHLAPAPPGSRVNRPVSFVDLAPTVLSLAGVEIPDYIQGEAFLGGQAAKPREFVHLYRGRMDERYDMMRAVRGRRFLYIRNYMPHRIYGQHLNYLWRAQSTRAWERAYREGRCNETQSRFWEPKPPEELYDCDADPYNVHNLAGDPEHRATLERMRQAETEHILSVRDAGFLAEPEMLRRAGQEGRAPYEMCHDPGFPLERIVHTADLASARDAGALSELVSRLRDADSGVRYWAATGCAVLGEQAASAAPALREALDDESPSVRVAAGEALCRLGRTDLGLPGLEKALADDDGMVVLEAINALQSLGDAAKPAVDAIRAAVERGRGYVDRAGEYALETLGQ